MIEQQEKVCPVCGKLFTPKRQWQTYCSAAHRKTHFQQENASQIAEVPSTHRSRATDAGQHLRVPRDGLRCRKCEEYIQALDGWRINCKRCDRERMQAWHNPATCKRKGCVVCMETHLAQSPELVAAWENEDTITT